MSPDEIKQMSGLEVLTAISDGRIDHPSMAYTLGFRLTEVEEGFAVIEGSTGPDYCNPNGTIHGAWPAALLDSCMGSAVHSMLPAGVGFTIVEFDTLAIPEGSPSSQYLIAYDADGEHEECKQMVAELKA